MSQENGKLKALISAINLEKSPNLCSGILASEKDTPATGLGQANGEFKASVLPVTQQASLTYENISVRHASHCSPTTAPGLRTEHARIDYTCQSCTGTVKLHHTADPRVSNLNGCPSPQLERMQIGTSPQPGSAPKKSVKHLECAYFFSPSGCKWKDPAHCLLLGACSYVCPRLRFESEENDEMANAPRPSTHTIILGPALEHRLSLNLAVGPFSIVGR